MAVLDQELGDLNGVRRFIGGAVANALPEKVHYFSERTQWCSATADAFDATAIERNAAEVMWASASFGRKASE
jgi:hypothetical protein